MQEFLSNLLVAVVTAAVPIITAYGISLLKKAAANTAADTEDIKVQGYIKEIANAISDAVAATSQTYVDALKQAGEFTKGAQLEATRKALAACMASICPAAQAFIEAAYGDLKEYLTTKIEAEVRKQKIELPTVSPKARHTAKGLCFYSRLKIRRDRTLLNYKQIYTALEDNKSLHPDIEEVEKAEAEAGEVLQKLDKDTRELVDSLLGKIARAYEMQGFVFGGNAKQQA